VVQLFRQLPRTHRTTRVSEEVRQIAHLLRDQCAKRLSWTDLARSVNSGPSQLGRRFRAERGVAPHLYQTQFQIDRAKRLVKRHVPLAMVAVESGFCDQSHFTH
jgi:AraC family transcriptional regulator